jgi:hypothetical protein
MRPFGRGMACVALLAALTGCSTLHIPLHQAPQAPPLDPGYGSLEAQLKRQHEPPPPLPPPIGSTVSPALTPVRLPKVKHPKRTMRAETNQATETAPETPTTPADAAPATPPHPAIGDLTVGDSGTESQTKHDTETLIAETDEGLAAIKRPLSKDEQTTAGQIRTFLMQAKQALGNGDSEGAHTLATKAKLLLDELTKQ